MKFLGDFSKIPQDAKCGDCYYDTSTKLMHVINSEGIEISYELELNDYTDIVVKED